jgi:regulatory protein
METKGPARSKRASGYKPKKERNRVAAHSPESLRRSGMAYVERYECSVSGFRDVLKRKIYQSHALHKDKVDPEELHQVIPDIIAEFLDKNWLNDERFAENRARSLFREGSSLQSIRFKLIEKGIAGDLSEQTIENLADETDLSKHDIDIDIVAAISYAQKRRIGPFRINDDAEQNRDKDMGALARRGFSFDIAGKILSTDREELEELIQDFRLL